MARRRKGDVSTFENVPMLTLFAILMAALITALLIYIHFRISSNTQIDTIITGIALGPLALRRGEKKKGIELNMTLIVLSIIITALILFWLFSTGDINLQKAWNGVIGNINTA